MSSKPKVKKDKPENMSQAMQGETEQADPNPCDRKEGGAEPDTNPTE